MRTRRAQVIATAALAASALAGACGDDPAGEPVKIGLSASTSGFDQEFGETAERVVRSAVAAINAAGGVDGRPLELIVEGDASTVDGAVAALAALREQGVVAVVGPFLSDQVAAHVDTIRSAGPVVVSPSATAPGLSEADDGGYLFRTAPDDTIQVRAMDYYFRVVVDPAVTEILIVHEEGSYGEGLRDALSARWLATPGRTLTADAISYPPGFEGNPTLPVTKWNEIAATSPEVIVLIGQGNDTNLLVRTWLGSGALPGVQWLLSDGSKSSSFIGSSGAVLPAAAEGLRGTAPTSPRTSVAFQAYVDAVGTELADAAFFPNTWDAVHLIAAALTAQSVAGEELGGPGLRDAITDVSRGGQIYHAGEWRDLVSQLRDRQDVDYDGASGPVDFDARGEVVSPYEVWEVQLDGTTWTFAQVAYMEVDELD